MWFKNFVTSLGRSAAIESLAVAAHVPGLAALVPSGKVRRLLSTASLPDLKYEGVYPQAVYAPWLVDPDFVAARATIKGHTLVDVYRCWELWNLVGQTSHLPAGDIVEVGVWRGGTGCLMARRSQLAGSTAEIHLCDTFTGVVKAGGQDAGYVGGEHADTSMAVVSALAARMNVPNVRIHKGMFPDETAHELPDRPLRLCHIDVDVYESASQAFDWAWPRLLPGGVAVFDDYGFYSCSGVTRLVNDMVGKPDRLVVYNNNGHALVVKLSN